MVREIADRLKITKNGRYWRCAASLGSKSSPLNTYRKKVAWSRKAYIKQDNLVYFCKILLKAEKKAWSIIPIINPQNKKEDAV